MAVAGERRVDGADPVLSRCLIFCQVTKITQLTTIYHHDGHTELNNSLDVVFKSFPLSCDIVESCLIKFIIALWGLGEALVGDF